MCFINFLPFSKYLILFLLHFTLFFFESIDFFIFYVNIYHIQPKQIYFFIFTSIITSILIRYILNCSLNYTFFLNEIEIAILSSISSALAFPSIIITNFFTTAKPTPVPSPFLTRLAIKKRSNK